MALSTAKIATQGVFCSEMRIIKIKVKTKNRRQRPRSKERMRLKRLAQSVFKDGIRMTPEKVIDWSQENKLHQTPAEKRFSDILKQIDARKSFKAQQALYGFIIDFYAPPYMLAIEIDGGYHDTPEQIKYDDKRTRKLRNKGIVLVRFKNEEVMQHPEKVMFIVQQKIKSSDILVKVRRKAKRLFKINKVREVTRVEQEKRVTAKVILLRRDGNTVRKELGYI